MDWLYCSISIILSESTSIIPSEQTVITCHFYFWDFIHHRRDSLKRNKKCTFVLAKLKRWAPPSLGRVAVVALRQGSRLRDMSAGRKGTTHGQGEAAVTLGQEIAAWVGLTLRREVVASAGVA